MFNYRVTDLKKILAEIKWAGIWVDPMAEHSEYGKEDMRILLMVLRHTRGGRL